MVRISKSLCFVLSSYLLLCVYYKVWLYICWISCKLLPRQRGKTKCLTNWTCSFLCGHRFHDNANRFQPMVITKRWWFVPAPWIPVHWHLTRNWCECPIVAVSFWTEGQPLIYPSSQLLLSLSAPNPKSNIVKLSERAGASPQHTIARSRSR